MRHQSLRPRHDGHGQDEVGREAHGFIHERGEQVRVRLQAPGREVLVLLRKVVNGKGDLEQGVAVDLVFELVEHLLDEDGSGVRDAVDAVAVAEEAFFLAFDAIDLVLRVGRAADLGDVLVGDFERASVQDAVEGGDGGNESRGRVREGGTGLQQGRGRARHFVVGDQDPELLDAAHVFGIRPAGGGVDVIHHPEHVFYVAHGRIWFVEWIPRVVAVGGCRDHGHAGE